MKLADSIIQKIKGFGLIEVLLSTVILGAGLVSVAQFQGNVYKDGSLSKQRAEALKLAEQKLEELRHFSTISEYQTNITSSLTNMKTAQTTVTGDTTTFTLDTYIKPESTGKSADLSVKVTWPDLTNSGSVTTDTTVQLSTVVSNNTPNNLAMTDIVPVLDPTEDPPIPLITIIVYEPSDTRTDVTDNSEACSCSTTTTTVTSSGGMMGGGGTSTNSTTTANTSLTEACTSCCSEIGGVWAKIPTDTLFAQLLNDLETVLGKDSSNYQKSSLGDYSTDQNSFNPEFLRKGYQQSHNINNAQPKLTDYERFIQKVGGMMGGGMMGGGSSSSTTTETNYGLCGYVKETVTTTTTYRNRMMGNWTL